MGPDCVVVFMQGASGDVTQVNNLNPDLNLSGEAWSRFVGGCVGAEAVKVLLSMPRGILSPVDASVTVLEMQRRFPDPDRVRRCYELVKQPPGTVGNTEWTFAKEIVLLDALLKKEPVAQVEVQAVQIGPAVFITNPAEFFCQLGLDIKKQSPFLSHSRSSWPMIAWDMFRQQRLSDRMEEAMKRGLLPTVTWKCGQVTRL